jgi:hypothetical protein
MSAAIRIDDDATNLLMTVCVAGIVRPSFNDASNERLKELADAGLIEFVILADPKIVRRHYRPTESGRALCRSLAEKIG